MRRFTYKSLVFSSPGGGTGTRTGLKNLHYLLCFLLTTERDTRETLSDAGFNEVAFQLTTTRYNSFWDSFGRKSGKKVQNPGPSFVTVPGAQFLPGSCDWQKNSVSPKSEAFPLFCTSCKPLSLFQPVGPRERVCGTPLALEVEGRWHIAEIAAAK